MKQLILLMVLFTFCFPSANAQEQKKDLANLKTIVPQEKIFIHYNSSLLFPGEYLYYKLYNLDLEHDNLSDISKVAYVELIDYTGTSIFKQKLNLNQGMGQGDFFIPTTVPSGNYKIVGYTKWMRNGGPENYFKGNITILNPYRNDQEALLNRGDTLGRSEPRKVNVTQDTKNDNLNIELIGGSSYGKREKVSFTLKDSDLNQITGNFSVSVRKKDDLGGPNRITSNNYLEVYPYSNSMSDSTFLPDIRGDLFYGKIRSKNKSRANLNNQKVAISIPGQDFTLRLSETDAEGNFKFILDKDYSGDEIFLEVLGDNRNNYNIEVNHKSYFNFNNLNFERFEINEGMKNLIVERSIYNQIENSYYSAKPDTLKVEQDSVPFYGLKNVENYKLDDYTRFKTLKETFTEIITNAKIREDKDGKPIFEVFPKDGTQDFGDPALLLVDGVYVQDTKQLVEYDALNIEEIRVVRDKYYYGPKVFRGIVAIKTRDNDFLNGFTKEYIAKESVIIPQLKKVYFKPDYSQNKQGAQRIPDFRLQLLWEPNYNISSNNKGKVEFYTSDVSGRYEISLEGFTVDGDPVSLTKEITVK